MLRSRMSRVQPFRIILVLSILVQGCGVPPTSSVVPSQVENTPNTAITEEVVICRFAKVVAARIPHYH